MMLSVSDFASKKFVQKACSKPFSPKAVLSFFFGVDFFDDETREYEIKLRDGTLFDDMVPIWFGQSDEYDALCRDNFAQVVRACGKRELTTNEWNGNVDGLMSQVLLTDQLSRNCFRGSEEAFQYDSIAEEVASKLLEDFQAKESTVPGEYYPSYLAFLLIPMMHTEVLSKHKMALEILDVIQKQHSDGPAGKFFELQRGSLLEHTQVLEEFGRYPHRNLKLGRESTEKEKKWLDDVDNLPVWAKSQK
jgi:uncharacterized protein (DUF924 family)